MSYKSKQIPQSSIWFGARNWTTRIYCFVCQQQKPSTACRCVVDLVRWFASLARKSLLLLAFALRDCFRFLFENTFGRLSLLLICSDDWMFNLCSNSKWTMTKIRRQRRQLQEQQAAPAMNQMWCSPPKYLGRSTRPTDLHYPAFCQSLWWSLCSTIVNFDNRPRAMRWFLIIQTTIPLSAMISA
jgi:hypothetical protein